MAWITVNVVCIVEDLEADEIREANVILERMDLPLKALPTPKTEIREAEINTKHIVMYYPANDSKKTIVECVNEHYSVMLEKKALKRLIEMADNG